MLQSCQIEVCGLRGGLVGLRIGVD